MKYVYGPVPSRRLGRSLGIDPIPSKTCNFQCIYCQLGKTNIFTNELKSYISQDEIISEMKKAISENENKFDYITFVGSGEPTLCLDLRELISEAKHLSNKPICVITNGALLSRKDVRNSLMLADVVLPSLDAGDEKIFIKINRPHPQIKYNSVIEGFIEFKKKFKGNFWIEIMLMKGINDSKEELIKIKEKLDLIMPDRIDINVPIRPPTEKWVKIPDKSVIYTLNEVFGDYANFNFPEIGNFGIYSSNFESELLNIIKRHPMRQDQIIKTFSSDELTKTMIMSKIKRLEIEKKIKKSLYEGKIFWNLVKK